MKLNLRIPEHQDNLRAYLGDDLNKIQKLEYMLQQHESPYDWVDYWWRLKILCTQQNTDAVCASSGQRIEALSAMLKRELPQCAMALVYVIPEGSYKK